MNFKENFALKAFQFHFHWNRTNRKYYSYWYRRYNQGKNYITHLHSQIHFRHRETSKISFTSIFPNFSSLCRDFPMGNPHHDRRHPNPGSHSREALGVREVSYMYTCDFANGGTFHLWIPLRMRDVHFDTSSDL